jgi:hypothetical protein
VIRISLSYIFNMCSRMDGLDRISTSDTEVGTVLIQLISAQTAIEELYNSIYGPYLKVSYGYSRPLLASLKDILDPFDVSRKIHSYQVIGLQQQYTQYKTALTGELTVMDSYFVTQKGGFDTASLLAYGENLFPLELFSKVPEGLPDVREAGRCLAFDLPTSAGFHVFRAVESVLRKYHAHVTGGNSPPKVRNMGVYIKSLITSGKGNLKVIAALQQMKDLHRNPVSHPEAILTQEEALAIFGIARSVITPMLAELPTPLLTTSAPAASALPAP